MLCTANSHFAWTRALKLQYVFSCFRCVYMCTVSAAQQHISANGWSLYPILNKSGMLFRCKMAEGMPPVLPLIQMPEEGRQSMPLPLGPSRIRPQQTLNSHPDSKHGPGGRLPSQPGQSSQDPQTTSQAKAPRPARPVMSAPPSRPE